MRGVIANLPRNDGVGLSRQKTKQLVIALDRRTLLGPRAPRQGVHRPAKANRCRSSLSANHVGVLLVSAYSQNDVAGTTQRRFLPNHPRQCGLFKFGMFVTGWPPNCGGPGIPQRAMIRQSRGLYGCNGVLVEFHARDSFDVEALLRGGDRHSPVRDEVLAHAHIEERVPALGFARLPWRPRDQVPSDCDN